MLCVRHGDGMKISAPKNRDSQRQLWAPEDPPLGNHGHVRTVLGDFAEELTAKLFGGRRHKTDSTCGYCPDVVRGTVYFECKAMGRSNQTFIYSGRLEKDREFAGEHWLGYVVWWHAVDTSRAETAGELRALMLSQLRGVFVVPFEAIDTIAAGKPVEPLNSKYGRSNEAGSLYGSGVRISSTELLPWLFAAWEIEPREFRA